jgi:hypothetical protein
VAKAKITGHPHGDPPGGDYAGAGRGAPIKGIKPKGAINAPNMKASDRKRLKGFARAVTEAEKKRARKRVKGGAKLRSGKLVGRKK